LIVAKSSHPAHHYNFFSDEISGKYLPDLCSIVKHILLFYEPGYIAGIWLVLRRTLVRHSLKQRRASAPECLLSIFLNDIQSAFEKASNKFGLAIQIPETDNDAFKKSGAKIG